MNPQPSPRMERKKEEVQNRIIQTSITLFNRYGLEAVTMEQIAEAADIARGTLYNYYPSKEAIINAYLQRTFHERNPERLVLLRQLPDTRARITRLLAILVEGVQAQKQVFETFMVYRMKQVLSFEPVEEGAQSGLSALVRKVIVLGQQSGELRADLPADVLEDLFVFVLIEAIKPLYLDPQHYDPLRSIEQSTSLFLTGAQPYKPSPPA